MSDINESTVCTNCNRQRREHFTLTGAPGARFCDRNRLCSFQPESLKDHCEKHRPTPPTGRDEMPEWVREWIAELRYAERCDDPGSTTRRLPLWLADSRDRLQSANAELTAENESLLTRLGDVEQEVGIVMADNAGFLREADQLRAALEKAERERGWQPIETAPKDGTLMLLLVKPLDHETENEAVCRTIGDNNFQNDGNDAWRFAGWNWQHDYWTQGVGTPTHWMLFPVHHIPDSEEVK